MAQQKLNILILEDEAFVAYDLAETVESAGHGVLGPFFTCEEATKSLARTKPDYAILDLHLGNGQDSLSVAHQLKKSEIPFTFATGYSEHQTELFRDFSDIPRLSKPFGFHEIENQLSTLMA
ncbi:hypothetical protein [Litorimonas sp.]|jgi:CheY-like chemotaxis protein|uniref:hypothetical protein n=1 Tax=Litorimonas sp. TaxID=1892381 RepID=UPI003A85C406